jgi:hypothetical protein
MDTKTCKQRIIPISSFTSGIDKDARTAADR